MCFLKTAFHQCRAVAASLILAAFPLSQAGGATLFLSPDGGGFAPETSGTTSFEFVIGAGWAVSNESEANVIATITSPVVIASGSSADLELRHSYSFEYDIFDTQPDEDGDAYDGGNLSVSVNGGAFTILSEWATGGYTLEQHGIPHGIELEVPRSARAEGNGLNAHFIDTTLPSPPPKAVYYRVVEVNEFPGG